MANWVEVWANQRNWLINLDKMESVMEDKDGNAQIEWGGGNCQITSSSPDFFKLKVFLIK